ncbi:MAG: 50S ribosomal protein L10 [Thermoguttaceae bacterium]|nr:50S ribosomal protein L10 [Thermoguttaceae bacterium]
MSRFVKDIIIRDLKKRLNGVQNALMLNVIGMDVNTSNRLRKDLVSRGINILVVKNSMAQKATAGTPLEALFADLPDRSCAVCWGASDIVALAKEIVRISKDKAFDKLEIRGGVLDGEAFTADGVVDISKWPTREEQISILLGQIVGVGSKLSSQLLAAGANLARQIKQLADKEEEQEEAPATEESAA